MPSCLFSSAEFAGCQRNGSTQFDGYPRGHPVFPAAQANCGVPRVGEKCKMEGRALSPRASCQGFHGGLLLRIFRVFNQRPGTVSVNMRGRRGTRGGENPALLGPRGATLSCLTSNDFKQ